MSIPPGIVGAVRQRLARLPEETVDYLRTAAIVGRTFDMGLLADALGVDRDHVRLGRPFGVVDAQQHDRELVDRNRLDDRGARSRAGLAAKPSLLRCVPREGLGVDHR